VAGDAELLHLSLARRDYLRHPLLLSEILALHALLRITSGPPRRAVARAIAELCRTQPSNPSWIETRLDQINFHFRQQGLGFGQDHLYAYDVETLAVRLTSAGFANIAERPYDPARDSRPYTIYVDARKPGRACGVAVS